MPGLYLTDEIWSFLAIPGVVLVASISGGKDSTVYLDLLKRSYPDLDVRLVFADTGAEYAADPQGRWPSTLDWCMQLSAEYGYPLTIVRNAKRNLLQEIEERKRFPSPGQRWCSAHHKRGPIWKYIRSINATHIISAQGHRADESDFRAGLSPWEIIPKLTVLRTRKTRKPRTVFNWLPIHHWTLDDILDYAHDHEIQLHPVYRFLERLSCQVCIYHGPKDFASTRKNNPEAFRFYAALEKKLNFTVSMSQKPMSTLADRFDQSGLPWVPATATLVKGYDCGYDY